MEWTKSKPAHRGDNINGGKLGNSAVWKAESNGFQFTACSDRKARHGGWVLRWKGAGSPFPRSIVCKNLTDAKARADRVISAT